MRLKSAQYSLRQYWKRRVLLPSLIAATVLAAVLSVAGIREIRNEREKHVHFVLKTVAMLASDPILLGDYLELSKRISTVASKYDFDVEVVSTDGRILSRYPNIVNDTHTLVHSIRIPIQSTDGRTIGTLSGGPHNINLNLDMVAMGFLAVSIVVLFLLFILIRAIEPIASDILALSSDTGTEGRKFKILEIGNAFEQIIAIRNTKLELERSRTFGEIASQVAHDIRSPLAALAMAEKDLAMLPEETRLIVRSAVFRIRDIANTLLKKNRMNKCVGEIYPELAIIVDEPKTIQLISAILDGIVSEKRMQFRSMLGLNIEFEDTNGSYGRFACIQVNEFKRVVSNLINNAVEAMPEGAGEVFVTLSGNETDVVVQIKDTGKGISVDVLNVLGKQGQTHGKANGNGLGLYHARTQCEAWSGRLEISSQIGVGTTIAILLPQAAEPPPWFVAELKLLPDSTVVVFDDDETVHMVWQGRADLEKLDEKGIRLVHLTTPIDLRKWHANWVNEGATTPVKYLCDYELLGFPESGLDLIEELGISKQSILVTSRFEETTIRERCNRLTIPLIPKGVAGFVPIRVLSKVFAKDKPAAILIDDDELVHLTWNMSAKQAGLHFLGYKTTDAFFKNAQDLDSSIPVYIDSHLGKNMHGEMERGEEIAVQIFEMGFKTIFLATGLAPANADKMTWLTGIRDKDPPFTNVELNKLG